MALLVYEFTAPVNTSTTFYFALPQPTATSTDAFYTGTGGPFAAGDSTRSISGGALAGTTNTVTQVSAGTALYSLTLTAAELNSTIGQVTVIIHDLDGPAFGDTALIIQTTEPAGVLRQSTATAGGATTITLDANASATNSYYNECAISITRGTGAGQARTIVSYVGSTQVATVNRAWATAPDNTSRFLVTRGGDVWDQLDGALITGPVTGANLTFRQDLQVLRRRFYNKVTQTTAVQTVYQDDNATNLTVMSVADDGVTQTKNVSS